ncbi:MAG: 4Fe-4S dicluster domain-containing protein [Candidatus Sumerlaeia bacterium]|nr:4Fe-4S dicluster domain-containing protein [Candidatus Sumerlaeia bacterium]
MAELIPAPFADLVTRLYLEPERQDALFELPKRAWYLPGPETVDMSVKFHGHNAGNPSGPASGPHTQMAQNILLSYIAGGRIMELKTVQVNDRLDIPRPCIDMTNVGYNVEWSQELRVEESLREYVAGMMLVTMARHAHPIFQESLSTAAGDIIYDISLGYDLEGIKSAKVQQYLDGIRDATAEIEKLRREIPRQFGKARDLDFRKQVSSTLTLSTFHGCPTDEIEGISEFLMAERDLDVIVKMNPPTLGKERLEHLLNDVMGYKEIHVRDSAYTGSQTFDEAVDMCRRLRDFAKRHGKNFGCKFSNTLEVTNHRDFFPDGNEAMYLSGLPLHVITLTLTDLFRQAVGSEVPISFSAGIDKGNFAATAACGFVPVTSCSDLLKTGGFARLGDYLKALEKEIKATDSKSLDEHILRVHGNENEARKLAKERGGDPVTWAGYLNTTVAAEAARADKRYYHEANSRVPKRIDSHLEILDCITCNKCLPVCPNAANFAFPSEKGEITYRNYTTENGEGTFGDPLVFKVAKTSQIANYADFCNECGNCDTFCPEYGGPYIEKPSFYLTRASFEEAIPRDGFLLETQGSGVVILNARIEGQPHSLEKRPGLYIYTTPEGAIDFDEAMENVKETRPTTDGRTTFDLGRALMLKVLLEGVMDTSRVNQVNAGVLAGRF